MRRDRNGSEAVPSRTLTATDAAGATAPATLERGATFGRYVVVERLGSGGMGVVYAAYDPELDRRLAVKVLRPDAARDQSRLRREAQAMARLQHPNVIAVYDVGMVDDRVFVAMELVDGTTLAQWLDDAPRPWPEVADLFAQAGRGLAAAHAVGLVHRDFKPANVLRGRDGRVRVVDFGLARSFEAGTEASPALDTAMSLHESPTPLDTLTRTGKLVGTPTYMSPEQFLGLPTDAKSDQFSFCVALYRALFGERPFAGEDIKTIAAEVTAGRLREPPRDGPVPTLVREAVLRGLATTPQGRWPSMDALLGALALPPAERFAPVEAAAAPASTDSPAPPSARRRWLALGATLAGAALVAAGAAGWRLHRRAVAPAEGASFAALGLTNSSRRADAAWLSTALTELLSAEVSAQGTLRRVPAERVSALRREMRLPDGELSPSELERVRSAVRADYVLSGSYVDDGNGRLRFDVGVQDTRSGQIVATVSESGSEDALPTLTSHAGAELRRRMGLSALSPADVEQARASLPTDRATTRLYAEGLAKLRLLDALGARDLLQRAVDSDPSFPLSHAALADAFRHLGHQAEEEREAQLAWTHAASLPRDQQLVVEANLRVARKEWPRAVELYRALYDFYPGSLDYGLRLAQVQIDAGQARDALTTIAQLRREVPAVARDARIELAEARACELLGDSRGQDAAAQAAVAKARAIGSVELASEALLSESMAALTLGDRPRAARTANEAYGIVAQIDNPSRLGEALRVRGWVAWKAGELPSARALLQQSVDIFEKLGDGDQLAQALNSLAGVESDLNHHVESLRLYRLALPLFVKAADRNGVAKVHGNLGAQLDSSHRWAEAEAEELQALAEKRLTGARRGQATTLEVLGHIYLAQGELQKSLASERQALALATELNDATGIAQTREKLGVTLGYLGQVAAAQEALAQAIGELDRLGESWRVGDAKSDLARLYLALGRGGEALPQAQRAVELHHGSSVDSSESTGVLARALVAVGRTADARAAVDRALVHGADDLGVQTAAAEVEVAERHPQLAIERLTRELARGPQPVPDRLEAELVLARAELAAGRTRAGWARLRALGDEARAKGFLVLARAAGSAR